MRYTILLMMIAIAAGLAFAFWVWWRVNPYAEMMERGGYWCDVQIAYTENPDATATCVHLQPVEHAMRHQGFMPYLFTQAWEPDAAALPQIQR